MNELRHKIFDPHVHFRDEEWDGKATMDAVVAEGQKVGIEHFIDMPNLPRPVIDRQRVDERIALAKKRGVYDSYHLYVGLTADPVQVIKAVDLVDQYDEVAGLKLFAGKSTGNLAVIDYEEQKRIYQALADAGYKRVLVVHCEDQTIVDRNEWRFDPERPWTWADARPADCEYYSIYKNIENIKDTGFKGRFQAAHISNHKSIGLIRAGLEENLDIGVELTPHHTLRSVEMLQGMPLDDAKQYKCNPSIKYEANRVELWNFMHDLKPDDPLYYKTYIGSDYAPHEPGSKLSLDPPSGFADYSLYNEFIAEAQKDRFGEQKLKDLLYNNAIRTFNLDVEYI